MTGAIFAYSRQGIQTARRVTQALPGIWQCYAAQRVAGEDFAPIPKPSGSFYGSCFARMDVLVFVSSCGIAVREIAPYVRDKATDPAVLCLDERGRFVIPLLSGHIGGANALARQLADALDATPVITTATDIHGRFSVDTWATEQGYALLGRAEAKAVSAAILEGDVPLKSDFPLPPALPSGVRLGETGPVGIYLTYTTATPFLTTLRLVPKMLTLGIGCRKGTSVQQITEAVAAVFSQHQLEPLAIKKVVSIDLKAQEPGLLEYCQRHALPFEVYTAQELNAVSGDFPPSEFVRQITGTDNVCQRAALAGGETLVVKKTCCGSVTIAVAAQPWEVHFG